MQTLLVGQVVLAWRSLEEGGKKSSGGRLQGIERAGHGKVRRKSRI